MSQPAATNLPIRGSRPLGSPHRRGKSKKTNHTGLRVSNSRRDTESARGSDDCFTLWLSPSVFRFTHYRPVAISVLFRDQAARCIRPHDIQHVVLSFIAFTPGKVLIVYCSFFFWILPDSLNLSSPRRTCDT